MEAQKEMIDRIATTLKPNTTVSQRLFIGIGAFWLSVMVLSWIILHSVLLPSPLEVVQAFPNLWFNEGLGEQLWVSFALNLQAATIMSLLSLVIAYLTVTPLFQPFAVLVSSGRANGFVGLPLIFMMVFSQVHWVKVALLVYGMTVFTVPSLVKMIDQIPKEEFDHARTLRMSEWRVVWEVVILGRIDQVIDVLRVNILMGFMMLPMVEGMFKFEGGVGALMMNQEKHFRMDAVYCATALVTIVGLAQDYAIGVFKKIACPYSVIGMERV